LRIHSADIVLDPDAGGYEQKREPKNDHSADKLGPGRRNQRKAGECRNDCKREQARTESSRRLGTLSA